MTVEPTPVYDAAVTELGNPFAGAPNSATPVFGLAAHAAPFVAKPRPQPARFPMHAAPEQVPS